YVMYFVFAYMEVKEILAPKNMMIALGTIVVIMSLYGMTHGDEWAEFGWGADNVQPHDEAYEEMWALHLMPLGIMAIITGMVVTGKELAKMAMFAPIVLVNIFAGMMILAGDNGYSTDPPGGITGIMGLVMMLTVILTGVSGYMHKDDAEEAGE
ncbi:MAG: hypothetical protein ACPGO6_06415, partial [Candidatus Poseidoniaceae archaeon]